MFKDVRLILVPFRPEKLEIGMFVSMSDPFNPSVICEGDNLEDDELKNMVVRPYLVSEDTIPVNEECIFKIHNQFIVAMPDDYLGYQVDEIFRIEAYPEQIGMIYKDTSFVTRPFYANCDWFDFVTFQHLQKIMKNSGICKIIIQESGQPQLTNGKVFIYILWKDKIKQTPDLIFTVIEPKS